MSSIVSEGDEGAKFPLVHFRKEPPNPKREQTDITELPRFSYSSLRGGSFAQAPTQQLKPRGPASSAWRARGDVMRRLPAASRCGRKGDFFQGKTLSYRGDMT